MGIFTNSRDFAREPEAWRNSVDGDLQEFGERLSGVETEVKGLRGSINHLNDSFTRYAESEHLASKPNYGTFIAGVSVVVVIIGMIVGGVMSGYVRDITKLETRFVLLNQKHTEHVKDGHPKWVWQGVDENRKGIVSLIDKVQKEEYRSQEHDNLDTAINATQTIQIKNLKERIESLPK